MTSEQLTPAPWRTSFGAVVLGSFSAAPVATAAAGTQQGLGAPVGLRLGTDDRSRALQMRLVDQPDDHDVILRHHGATLFVSPRAADRLGHSRLHASLDGRPAFYLD